VAQKEEKPVAVVATSTNTNSRRVECIRPNSTRLKTKALKNPYAGPNIFGPFQPPELRLYSRINSAPGAYTFQIISSLLKVFLFFPLGPCLVLASTLPEERADAMYHSYDGGGVTIDGPSLLVRKNFKETVSISANYYVDNVSSASIDVITSGASSYSETRTQYSVGADYLHGKSVFSAGYTSSDESDYHSDTYSFNISQDFFGDLTNISFGYSLGIDEVKQNGNAEFSEDTKRHNYRFNVSQILTPKLIVDLGYEMITDEGFLNNPYRSYRFLNNPLDPSAGYQLSQEVYPATRTSDAAALRFRYHMPWQASVSGQYRFFTDDWGIDAHTAQIGYTHRLRKHWYLDLKYRHYQQTAADFYSDLFLVASQDEKDYRARDKELSQLDNQTASVYLSYAPEIEFAFIDKLGLTLQWDRIWFNYDNFTDLRETDALPGQESLFTMDANVIKLVFTLWY